MSKYFTREELACKCCGKCFMNEEFMAKLEQLREEFNEPMIITSAYRCPKHNTAIGGGAVHPFGRAVDVAISGAKAWKLLRLALGFGFTGIGLEQQGPKPKRFIHLDNWSDPATRPNIWTY